MIPPYTQIAEVGTTSSTVEEMSWLGLSDMVGTTCEGATTILSWPEIAKDPIISFSIKRTCFLLKYKSGCSPFTLPIPMRYTM